MALKVGVFGTFDVQNYGDLLFPVVATWRLRKFDMEVAAYSPTHASAGWRNIVKSRKAEMAFLPRPTIDAALVGGGNIIHTKRVQLLDYRQPGLSESAYASIWVLPALMGAAADIPVVWNAPGVPAALTPAEVKGFVKPILSGLSYASVRDAGSATHLGLSPSEIEAVVPDTAIEIASVWPMAELLPHYHAAMVRKGMNLDTRILALHVKERSLDAADYDGLQAFADQITATCKTHGLVPAILSLAPCHHDDVFARRLGRMLGSPAIVFDDHLGLMEIAALIAHAQGYIGASLHGFITASSYGTPALLVTRPDLPKFSGFAEQTGLLSSLCASWDTALKMLVPSPDRTSILPSLQPALDQHWTRVAEALSSGTTHRPHRSAMLRKLTHFGLAQSRSEWALKPFETDTRKA